MTQITITNEGAFDKTVREQVNTNFGELYSVASPTLVNCGATRTLTAADAGKTILLDTAAGCTVTLPPATGSGAVYTFITHVTLSSNSHIIKVANANDAFYGLVFLKDDTSDNAVAFGPTAGVSDTITMNRSTTGGTQFGEMYIIRDISNLRFSVLGFGACTGTPATPFSATV